MIKPKKRRKVRASELSLLPAKSRFYDRDGDPWRVMARGCAVFPDDPDRRVVWPWGEMADAEDMHGPFKVSRDVWSAARRAAQRELPQRKSSPDSDE